MLTVLQPAPNAAIHPPLYQSDLFGEIAPAAPRPRQSPIRKAAAPDPVIEAGMFDLAVNITPERFHATYASGSSAYFDAKGLIDAGKDIGVVADLLQPRVILRLRTYLRSGGKVFCDSGAYTAFKKWNSGQKASPLADFEEVFATYDRIVHDLPSAALSRLALVMPDVLQHPEWSLDLLRQYRGRILTFVDSGVQAIVPIQKGPMRAGDTANTVAGILGTSAITLGIPSAAAAMSLSDVASIRGFGAFHILGRGKGMPLYQRAYACLEHNPTATVSCDANQLRSRTGELSQMHSELIESHADSVWDGEFDETELLQQILDDTGWLTRPQVHALARSYGVNDGKTFQRWEKAHKSGEGLRPLVEEVDPECDLLWSFAMRNCLGDAARKHLSARLRAVAVAGVFAAREAA